MDRYMIESPHDPEDCDRILQEVENAGYMHYFDWGCHAGVHTGWAIIETNSFEHARQIVPWQVRDRARIVKVEKLGREDTLHPYTSK